MFTHSWKKKNNEAWDNSLHFAFLNMVDTAFGCWDIYYHARTTEKIDFLRVAQIA